MDTMQQYNLDTMRETMASSLANGGDSPCQFVPATPSLGRRHLPWSPESEVPAISMNMNYNRSPRPDFIPEIHTLSNASVPARTSVRAMEMESGEQIIFLQDGPAPFLSADEEILEQIVPATPTAGSRGRCNTSWSTSTANKFARLHANNYVSLQSSHDVRLQLNHDASQEFNHKVRPQRRHDVRLQTNRDIRLQTNHDVSLQPNRAIRFQQNHDVKIQPNCIIRLRSNRNISLQPNHDVRVQSSSDVKSQPNHDVRLQTHKNARRQFTNDVGVQSYRDVRIMCHNGVRHHDASQESKHNVRSEPSQSRIRKQRQQLRKHSVFLLSHPRNLNTAEVSTKQAGSKELSLFDGSDDIFFV